MVKVGVVFADILVMRPMPHPDLTEAGSPLSERIRPGALDRVGTDLTSGARGDCADLVAAPQEVLGAVGGPGPGVVLRTATSRAPGADEAVREVASQLGAQADLFLVFVAEGYDLRKMAAALRAWAGPRVIACTSAGGIGPRGFEREGLVAVAVSGPDLRVATVPITPLSDLDAAWSRAAGPLRAVVEPVSADAADPSAFAILLVDGLSLREEAVAAQVLARLEGIPLVGGSAGDDLRFARAAVLVDGEFVADAATVTVVTTSAPFRRFRLQHHDAGETALVVTGATPAQRLVHTLNGRRAAFEYADVVGVTVDQLTPRVFSAHPLVLRAGGGNWVRSISGVEPDDSLRFFCAADPGSVLRLGRSWPPVATLEATFDELTRDLGEVSGMLIFDCILRRLEYEQRGVEGEVGRILARYRASGFSTYGEQYDGVHVNQTMVGIAFGR